MLVYKQSNQIMLLFSGDFLYVYDGNTTDPKLLLNTETGIIIPTDAHSTGEDMILVFTSDFSLGKAGFKASISFLQSGM